MVICGFQIFMLFLGVYVGHGAAECEIRLPAGAGIEVDCNRCRLLGGLKGRDIFLLLAGVGTILVGVYAAVAKSKHYCRVYGLTMMVFAFMIGLTGLLTGLEVPVLEAAAAAVGPGMPDCEKIAFMMVDTARDHSILYGINCVLDCAGAIFAIYSKQLFDYEAIESSHKRAVQQQDAGL
jgi:hypothetical protein|eukprot:Stramenopile-MAST_4_protein_4853